MRLIQHVVSLSCGVFLCANALGERYPVEIDPQRLVLTGAWTREHDSLTNRSEGAALSQIAIKEQQLESLEMSFTARLHEGSESTHLGVVLVYDDGRTLRLYSWLDRFALQEKRGDQSVRHTVIHRYQEPIAWGEDAPAVRLRVAIEQGKGSIFRDEEESGFFEVEPGNITEIQIYVWEGVATFRELELKGG